MPPAEGVVYIWVAGGDERGKNGSKNYMIASIFPPELDEQERESEESHKAFIAALEKPERKLVLRIIDAQDS